jgi:hypothetical protein
MDPYLSKLNMEEHPRTIKIHIKLNSHEIMYLLTVDCSLKGKHYRFHGQTAKTKIQYSVFNPLTKQTQTNMFLISMNRW